MMEWLVEGDFMIAVFLVRWKAEWEHTVCGYVLAVLRRALERLHAEVWQTVGLLSAGGSTCYPP